MTALVGPRLATLLAVLAGAALALAFPPVAFGPYATVGVALLTAALWGGSVRRGLLLGPLTGMVFFLILLAWMRVIGPDAWILLSMLCASWMVIVGIGTALVTRLPAAPLWAAALWVTAEALRGRVPFGGFPWGNLAFAQPDTPLAGYAAWAGSPAATFVVALVGTAVIGGVVHLRQGRTRSGAGWIVAAIALVLIPTVMPPGSGAEPTAGTTQQATLAIVQGGTPQVGMGAMDVRRAVLDNHVAQTLDLAAAIDAGQAPQPEFVLWPENSSDIDPFSDASVASAITAAARAVNAPIVIGAVITSPENDREVWNVGVVWDPETGPGQMYVKTHPVPFGEYIPFREQLADLVGRFDRIPRDFAAGPVPGNLDVSGVPVGLVICFEVAYSDVVDAVVDGGAQVLAVQTNNATYGGTAQPAQQLAIERLRAIEFGRTVIVAATSGISAVIGTDGVLVAEIPEGQSGWVVEDVTLHSALTGASRFGHVIEWLIVGLALIGLAWALIQTAGRRRRGTRGEVDDLVGWSGDVRLVR